jgi:hypothetical protein
VKRKVLLLASVLLVLLGAIATAQEGLSPYVSIRYSGGIQYRTDDYKYTGENLTALQTLGSGSRLGLRYRGDEFELQAEFRFDAAPGVGPVYLMWKPGNFSLLAGYNDGPTNFSSNISLFEFSHGGYGDTGMSRVPQIKAGYKFGNVGAYVTLFETTGWGGITNPGGATGNHSPLPPFALGADFNSGNISIGGGFAGSLVDVDADDGDGFGWMGYLHGNIKFGAPYIRFNFAYEYSRNLLLGSRNGNTVPSAGTPPVADDSALEDGTIEGFLEFGYAMDVVTIALAGGYVQNLTKDDNRLAIGATATIPVRKSLRIIPGVIYYNELETRDVSSSGSRIDAGVKLQLDF